MNKLDFTKLVAALKRGSSNGVGFKLVKLGNFDGVQNWKVVDAWLAKMEDYLHAAKVGRLLTMELAQSYLKGYASTWWRTVRQEEGKTHGYMWEFFKERIELEFIPKNSDYISRCKLCGLVNATNDNLRQCEGIFWTHVWDLAYAWVRSCVPFFDGASDLGQAQAWGDWPASLSEAIMKVEDFLDVGWGKKIGFKKDNKFPHKKARHEGEWNQR